MNSPVPRCRPLGQAQQALLGHIFGNNPRPGALAALRTAAEHDIRLFNLKNRAIWLENLEYGVAELKQQCRRLKSEMFRQNTDGVKYFSTQEAADHFEKQFVDAMNDFAGELQALVVLRGKLRYDPRTEQQIHHGIRVYRLGACSAFEGITHGFAAPSRRKG